MMSDIFISYAREDRTRVEPLAKVLDGQGWSVWWDPEIKPGEMYDDVIDDALRATRCVIVVWSEKSIKSHWVRDEARRGAKKGALIPVLIEDVEPPIGLGLYQAANLTAWRGQKNDPELARVIARIRSILGDVATSNVGNQRSVQTTEKKKSSNNKSSDLSKQERFAAHQKSDSNNRAAAEILNAPASHTRKDSRVGVGGGGFLYWEIVFLTVAIIAGVLGFGGVASASAGIAQILFFVFLVLLVISLIAYAVRGRRPPAV